MTDNSKRLLKDFLITGLTSPILILLLALIGGEWVPFLLVMPFNGLCIRIGSAFDFLFSPRGGAWFQGMENYALGIHVVACIEVWIVLFVFLRLIRMQINRREKRDAEDDVSLHLNLM